MDSHGGQREYACMPEAEGWECVGRGGARSRVDAVGGVELVAAGGEEGREDDAAACARRSQRGCNESYITSTKFGAV